MEGSFMPNSLQADLRASLSGPHQPGSISLHPSMATVPNTRAEEPDWLASLDALNGGESDFDWRDFDNFVAEPVEEPSHQVDGIPDDNIDPNLVPCLLPPFQEQVELPYSSNVTAQSSVPPQLQLPRQYQSPIRQFQSPKAQYPSPNGKYQNLNGQYVQPSQVQFGLPALPQQPTTRHYRNETLYPSLYQNHASYQPQAFYPDAGINGHKGAMSFPLVPPGLNQMVGYLPPAHATAYAPVANPYAQPLCVRCGRMAHYGACPPPEPYIQPAQSLSAQVLQPEQGKSAPERRWMDESDDDQIIEPPAKDVKKGGKNINRVAPRATKAKKVTKDAGLDIFPYPAFGLVLPWKTTHGLEISYLSAGQWDEDILFTAKDLRDYLEQCPRKPKIWLQNSPSKCKGRIVAADMKCRYSECPAKFGTILHGWHRVAFDEFHELTSNGAKDPFKVAGVMHLWCLEQCFDPLDLMEKSIMFPDERKFPHEDSNRMAITRDDYKKVVEGAIKPWYRERKRVGATQVPYEKHEDTLSWILCDFHIKHQNSARGRCRNMRNADRPDDEKKTVEIIMGNLSEYAEREQRAKARTKRRYAQSKLLSSEPVDPPQVGRESPRTHRTSRRIVEDVPKEPKQEQMPYVLPPISEADFADLANYLQENKGDYVITRPLTPQSLGPEVQGNIDIPDVSIVQVLESPSRMFRISPPGTVKVQDSIRVSGVPAGQPLAFPSSTLCFPSTGSATVQDGTANIPDVPTTQAVDSPLGLGYLFGSPTGSNASSGSRKRSRTEEEVATSGAEKRRRTSSLESQRSGLRRSSRVSAKRTSLSERQ